MTLSPLTKSKLLRVLAWLSLIDVASAMLLQGLTFAGVIDLQWFSPTCTITTLIVFSLTGSTGDSWAATVQLIAGMVLALLAPWWLFRRAARAREASKEAAHPGRPDPSR